MYQKFFDGKKKNYYASPKELFPKSNYYVNVFDDFLIEVWLDPKVTAEIDLVYEYNKVFDNSIKDKLIKDNKKEWQEQACYHSQ